MVKIPATQSSPLCHCHLWSDNLPDNHRNLPELPLRSRGHLASREPSPACACSNSSHFLSIQQIWKSSFGVQNGSWSHRATFSEPATSRLVWKLVMHPPNHSPLVSAAARRALEIDNSCDGLPPSWTLTTWPSTETPRRCPEFGVKEQRSWETHPWPETLLQNHLVFLRSDFGYGCTF